MKKRILSLALALTLILALVPATLAAQRSDAAYDIQWLGNSPFTYSYATPHDYLGDVSIGNLWLGDYELATWTFGVYIVDDNRESFEVQGYFQKKNTAFFGMNEDTALSELWLEDGSVFISEVWGEYEGEVSKADPYKYSFSLKQDAWMPQIGRLNLYNGDYEYLGWLDCSVIVFTKSQFAAFKSSGKLPPMTNMWGHIDEQSVDLSSHVDLTQLKALLSDAASSAPTPAIPAPTTPAPAVPDRR